MRRPRAEWLLLPLLLLPFLCAGGLLWAVRGSYRSEIEGARREGSERVASWLRRDPTLWRERFLARLPSPPQKTTPLLFSRSGGGTVRALLAGGPGEPWSFSDRYPGGLGPAALKRLDVRVAVETGRAPVSLEGIEPSAQEFARLLQRPDLPALREAPFPAATKQFLLESWLEKSPTSGPLKEARRILDAATRFCAISDLAPGWYRSGSLSVLAGKPGAPLLLYPEDPPAQAPLRERDTPDGNLELRYGASDGPALWRGRLDAPVAGEWTLSAVHGGAWWEDARFRRWAGPAGAALLAFLLLPGALWISMSRRRRLEEARIRFLDEIAHDLRTPLTSLRMHAELLASDKTPPGRRAKYAGVLNREAARLSGLLQNLLDQTRLDRRRRTFRAERLQVRRVAQEAAEDFRGLHPARAADLVIEGGDEQCVRGDPTALFRCVENLLDNAAKYTPAGTPITLAWEPRGAETVISVQDAGPGVPARDRKRIFSRYVRGRAATESGVAGTGMGLSLVQDLVRGMGGSVVLAERERGARFELRLPGGEGGEA